MVLFNCCDPEPWHSCWAMARNPHVCCNPRTVGGKQPFGLLSGGDIKVQRLAVGCIELLSVKQLQQCKTVYKFTHYSFQLLMQEWHYCKWKFLFFHYFSLEKNNKAYLVLYQKTSSLLCQIDQPGKVKVLYTPDASLFVDGGEKDLHRTRCLLCLVLDMFFFVVVVAALIKEKTLALFVPLFSDLARFSRLRDLL